MKNTWKFTKNLEKSWKNLGILENWEPFIVQCGKYRGVHLLTVLLLYLFSVEGILQLQKEQ